MVDDNHTGFLVEAGDHAAMADRVIHLMEHPDLLNELGSKAAEVVKERFSMTQHAESILEIYKDVLARSNGALRSD